jgi:hypothetical protein
MKLEEEDKKKQNNTKVTKHNKDEEELWNADPNCKHKIVNANGGGIRCIKCGGWFCY